MRRLGAAAGWELGRELQLEGIVAELGDARDQGRGRLRVRAGRAGEDGDGLQRRVGDDEPAVVVAMVQHPVGARHGDDAEHPIGHPHLGVVAGVEHVQGTPEDLLLALRRSHPAGVAIDQAAIVARQVVGGSGDAAVGQLHRRAGDLVPAAGIEARHLDRLGRLGRGRRLRPTHGGAAGQQQGRRYQPAGVGAVHGLSLRAGALSCHGSERVRTARGGS